LAGITLKNVDLNFCFQAINYQFLGKTFYSIQSFIGTNDAWSELIFLLADHHIIA